MAVTSFKLSELREAAFSKDSSDMEARLNCIATEGIGFRVLC